MVILIKGGQYILLSYNNRGPPAGPGRGPAWGPSRGFRFSRFSQNFCIFRNFQDFPWFCGIFWNFQFSPETGASLAAHAKTLIFLREYWWFWGVLHCKVSIFCENHENHEIHGTSWKLWNFMKFHVLCGNVDFCSEAHPKIINIPIGISTFPVPGPGELRFHNKSRKFMIICNLCWNSKNPRNPLNLLTKSSVGGPDAKTSIFP